MKSMSEPNLSVLASAPGGREVYEEEDPGVLVLPLEAGHVLVEEEEPGANVGPDDEVEEVEVEEADDAMTAVVGVVGSVAGMPRSLSRT